MDWDESFRNSRRRLLFMLLGTAGAIVAADKLFARKFAGEAVPVELPDMVYDPDLQMMVDPVTREPIYARAAMITTEDTEEKKDKDKDKPKDKNKTTASAKEKKKSKPLPTVTAGCSKCPKCDDNCG